MCLKPSEAQRSLKNKADIHRWMKGSNVLIDYYESAGKSFAPPIGQ